MKRIVPIIIFVIMSCVCLGVFCSVSFAQVNTSLRLPVSPEEMQIGKTDWYGIYIQGKKVGYSRSKIVSGDPNDSCYLAKTKIHMQLKALNQKEDITIEISMNFNDKPPYAFQHALVSTSSNSINKSRVEIIKKDEGFEAITSSGGEKQINKIPTIDFTLEDFFTPKQWIKQNPNIGDKISIYNFDPSTLMNYIFHYEIISKKETTINGVNMNYYDIKATSTINDSPDVLTLDNKGNALFFTVDGRIEFRIEDEASAKDLEYSEDLFVKGMALIDKPLGDPSKIQSLVVELLGKSAPNIKNGPNQSVIFNDKMDFYTLKAGPEHGKQPEITPEDIEKNVEETINYPIKHDKINEIAKKAIKGARTEEGKVNCLVNFVKDFIQDEISIGKQTVFEIISEKKGDCSEHALLFTTLARAVGIPAREVSGLSYMGDKTLAFGPHAWNEVLLDGKWVTVDPISGQINVDPLHIRIEPSDYGKISFRLLELNHFPLKKDELELNLKEILKEPAGEISLRKQIDDIFALGRIYEEEGKIQDAMKLYELALKTNSWNLKYQLRLARLLEKIDSKNEAIDKAMLVFGLAENEELVKQSKEVLLKSDINPEIEKTAQEVNDDIEIVLVPLGIENYRVISELKDLLEKRMGIKFSISNKKMETGDHDRTMAWKYVEKIFDLAEKELDEKAKKTLLEEINLTADDLGLQENKIKFIKSYVSKMGYDSKRTSFNFDATFAMLKRGLQYNYSRLLEELKKEFQIKKNTTDTIVRGYLAVTPEDLYDGDNNFVFGMAQVGGGYGVISYHRFAAQFTGEDENRPRLIKRILRQSLSSSNFLLGITRCTNPNCARAFPNSLAEHDQKPDKLCKTCQLKLDQYTSFVALSRYMEHDKEGNLPENGDAYVTIAEIYEDKGMVKESLKARKIAISKYEKPLKTDPHNAYYYLQIGSCYYFLSEYEKAISYCEQAIGKDSTSFQAYDYLGLSNAQLILHETAVLHYKKSIEINPKSHITNYNLALSYVQLQNYEEAILCLQKAVALKPDYVDAYCERGKTYVKLKKYNDAIKQLRKAVEINPDHYSSNLNLGRAYGESGSLEESIESLKKAIEINRNDPLVWNNLGYTYYLKRMYKKAMEQYETGLTISSEDPLTHYNKALAHVSLKEFADAFKHFNHAADLGYPVKPSLLKDLETLLQHSEK